MIHINKTPSGKFNVMTINSDDNKEALSNTGRENFSRKEKAFVNIRAHMDEWRSEQYVLVQDNTLKTPKVFKVYRGMIEETDIPTESTRKSRKQKAAKKKAKKAA